MKKVLPIKLIAVDLDGTLLNHQGEISKVNSVAIQDAQKQGIRVAICTGRAPEIAGLMIRDAGLDCPILGINGAIIAETPLGPHFIRHFMAQDTAHRLFEILEKNPFEYCVFGEQSITMRTEGLNHFTVAPFGDRLAKETKQTASSGLDGIIASLEQNVCKFVVWEYKVPGDMQVLREEIESVENIELMQSWSNNIEIMPKGVNKGTAVQEFSAYCRIPLSQVMTIGDQENDLSMLLIAGYGVAMGNATDEVKASVKYVTDTCENDGVAKAIYNIALPSVQ